MSLPRRRRAERWPGSLPPPFTETNDVCPKFFPAITHPRPAGCNQGSTIHPRAISEALDGWRIKRVDHTADEIGAGWGREKVGHLPVQWGRRPPRRPARQPATQLRRSARTSPCCECCLTLTLPPSQSLTYTSCLQLLSNPVLSPPPSACPHTARLPSLPKNILGFLHNLGHNTVAPTFLSSFLPSLRSYFYDNLIVWRGKRKENRGIRKHAPREYLLNTTTTQIPQSVPVMNIWLNSLMQDGAWDVMEV